MDVTPPPGSDGVYRSRKGHNAMNNQFYVDTKLIIRDYYAGNVIYKAGYTAIQLRTVGQEQ